MEKKKIHINNLQEESKKAEKLEIDDGTDRLLSVKEVAVRLRAGQSFINALLDVGLLKFLKFKRDRRIPKSVFNKFIADHLGDDLYQILAEAKKAA